MRTELIVEMATNFGPDIDLAKRMIQAAAEAGADVVKTQGYDVAHLRKSDPQYEWFRQCQLSDADHCALMHTAKDCGVRYLSTAYHWEDLRRLKALDIEAVKIGSGEGRSNLVYAAKEMFLGHVYVTVPWGEKPEHPTFNVTWLATVPLYPAPLETYARVKQLDGYSDHHVGLTAAKLAIAHGAKVLEKHFHIDGCPSHRQQLWNLTPESLRELRTWAEECAQALDGTKYEGRWCA